ncbi:hypothetical protein [Dolichospermum phage Dfl-JY23]
MYFSEIIGNGGVTLQILQVFEVFHKFVDDSIESIKNDPGAIDDCLKELEEICLESGEIHPDLYMTLKTVSVGIEKTFKYIASVPGKTKTKATVKTVAE